mmetsp:Transcript_650/g.1950  ORF Transcript_650/g.1950 Transcript_650/m.1950 type:complete len:682 (-) Transcript_650:48-2093(-)
MSDALTETFEEEYRPLPGDEGGPAAAVAARRRPKYLVAAALFCAGAAFAVPAVIDWQFRANLAANTRLKSKSDPFYDSWASNEKYAIGYDIYYFNLTNPHEVAYEGAKPNVTEHGPYSYDQHFVNFDASWITPGRKDVDMYTKTWYEFNAERSHALGCHNCNDTADMLTTWDVVVSGVLEDVAGLPGPISAAGRYALKLAMCAAQKTPKVYPFATRSVRDLHFGRWHDPLLTELVGAIDVLPDAVKSKLPAAFATLTSYVPGFETNYTDKAYARRANGARDRVDSGVRKNGARAMRQTRAWGSRYCRVCLAPTHAGNESQKLQPYCDAQKPEWDHLDEEEGEALANAAGWYLAYANRAGSKVDGFLQVVKPAGRWNAARFGGGTAYGSGQAFRRMARRAFETFGVRTPVPDQDRVRGAATHDTFVSALYRALRLRRTDQDGELSRRGMPLDRYEIDRESVLVTPQPDFDQLSTPSGLMNMSRANGIPLLGSLPHFLDADPSVQATVVGLHPNRARHNTEVDIEPRTGVVAHERERLQFNGNLFDYALPGDASGVETWLAEELDKLFPGRHVACDTSNASWAFPRRLSDDGRREEMGGVVPVGYIDRKYDMNTAQAKELSSSTGLVEALEDGFLAGGLLLCVVLLLLAVVDVSKHRRAAAAALEAPGSPRVGIDLVEGDALA